MQAIKCPMCGHENVPEAVFCEACGTRLVELQDGNGNPPAGSQARSTPPSRQVNVLDVSGEGIVTTGQNSPVTVIKGNTITDLKLNFGGSQPAPGAAQPESRDAAPGKTASPAGDQTEQIFVSYAWGGESERIVDDLESAFTAHGLHLTRDKKDLAYKESIEAFEKKLARSRGIILVISHNYLRSEHCMFELIEAADAPDLKKRIFPIVLEDARILKSNGRMAYIRYWEEEIRRLDGRIRQANRVANLPEMQASLDKCVRIRACFDRLAGLIGDMDAKTPAWHAREGYSSLIEAVRAQLREP
jgi:hypothetical protein